ncbi:hypothetical protein BC937DRAFT_92408 [Endogone sp. FLAS-F59071]|nr:hypothetical protein BC937DRAFT_92408 [Endogone sp. FLAS-F59071]|eukprot:RUS21531.1 hypothetical protein BC937DRAFT_92408 [Endogone sp. FLAS-F59071]
MSAFFFILFYVWHGLVERHHPRIVKLEYRAPDQSKVRENLYFVGKGVTYDTGGADIKAGGVMRASVAGFLKTVSLLAPEHVNITAGLSFVRNSVGSNSYVSDEVILSRAGVRVLIGNTDAEGRLVMTDLLTEFKDAALAEREANSAPSILFTVATLTGHALRAYGGYGIALDTNVSARQLRVSRRIFDAGHVWGDPFEISTLRRDDMEAVAPGSTSEDVVQANDKPSSATMRGHQFPAGYLVIASGLDKHGSSAVPEQRVAYTHLDIAGSAETLDGVGLSLPTVTGSPVPALAGAFLL